MRWIHPDLETSMIFEGNDRYPFSLEGIVIPLDNGELFATFTTGGESEPVEENVTCMTRSADGGKTWAAPEILFAHSSLGVFTPTIGYRKGVIYAYPNTYTDETNFAENMQSYFSISRDGGHSFTPPRSLPGCINNVHIKQFVLDGERMLLPFSWRETEGEAWCYPASGAGSKPAMLAGRLSDCRYMKAHATGEEIRRAGHEWGREHTNEYVGVLISDDGGKTYRIRGRLGGEVRHLCEPTLARLPDGTLLMYIRSNTEKALFESRSSDGGETWSPLKRLDLPTPITKVRLYTRSNGDLLLLHNPSNECRSPLSLWISRDMGESWCEKIDLIRDDERPLAYPDGFIDEESGCLMFAWEDRRNIYFSKWRL